MPNIISINLSPGGIPKLPVGEVRVLAGRLEGDGRNHEKHDRAWRAVSILDVDQIARFTAAGYELVPGAMGENLTVEGLDCRALEPGDRLEFDGGVVLEISEPRIPCYVLDAIDKKLQDDSWGHCGAMARVVREGQLRAGEGFVLGGNRYREPAEPWPHTAAILAGGLSSRMGRPKEGVALADGRPMIEHIIAALEGQVARIVVVGRCEGWAIPEGRGIGHIEDRRQQIGPIGGLDALLASGLDSQYMVMTCDQPFIDPMLVRILSDRASDKGTFLRSEMGEKWDPFPGVFPASWAGAIEERIAAGHNSVFRFIREQKTAWVTLPVGYARRLRNINTVEELNASQKQSNQ